MNKKIGTAMVVGAGIGGIRAALDLAETGYRVTLIDRSPHPGGVLSKLDHQFPTNNCGMCRMLPLVERDASSQHCLRRGLDHDNIEVLPSTELIDVQGEPGKFEVTLRQKPQWVDPARCIGCGACVEVCPVEVKDPFNQYLSLRKAIYRPTPHAIDSAYIIDAAACTRCKACEKICPSGAIAIAEGAMRNFRILVVDDELIVRDSLKETLYEQGYGVDMADSGAQALEKLADNPYHLMLLDIKMPGMDGVEVLKAAKTDFPELTVVMMTAYATVETAVDAMKIGALDYLIKPFEPTTLLPMVHGIYENMEAASGPKLTVGALVLGMGTDYFNPQVSKNPFGYGIFDNVVTSLEFERILSAGGPGRGRIVRPGDGKSVEKIAWIQCVGSRDLQQDADFCSNICCMVSVKEALLAKDKTNVTTGGEIDTAIFYMDMRTFGKSFQRYRDNAENQNGVRFERSRIHSITTDAAGDLILRHTATDGQQQEETFNLVVLATGQRPAAGTAAMAEMLQLERNRWGFVQPEPLSLTRTNREGVVLAGSFAGLKDISDSVIQASAAALNASRIIHKNGGGLSQQADNIAQQRDEVGAEPQILVALCDCNNAFASDLEILKNRLGSDPAVSRVEILTESCSVQGWEALLAVVEKHTPNRLLVGACAPLSTRAKKAELALSTGLDPALIVMVDIRRLAAVSETDKTPKETHHKGVLGAMQSTLTSGLVRLKRVEPRPPEKTSIQHRALVVGGGIAGMSAALAVADHGFEVDLVEKAETLGGNLGWLKRSLEGHDIQAFLDETVNRVKKHPLINTRTKTRVGAVNGAVGDFRTTLEWDQETDAKGVESLSHGAVILAVGGDEATTSSYGYGQNEQIITQKQLTQKLDQKEFDPGQLKSLVMIQCVDSREEPNNYCSRVCCASALKNALRLKEANPQIKIYILYRDMMTYGFTETYYTRARQADIIFIQYEKEKKPAVNAAESLTVTLNEPIIGRDIILKPDYLVLSTGITTGFGPGLAETFGVAADTDGFFAPADSKWRPVDSIKAGIFACGLVLAPFSVAETVATAEAAAQRALGLLSQQALGSGRIVSGVHQSICSQCLRCIDACPYGARSFDTDLDQIAVNTLACQGCGACAMICPNDAAYVEGFTKPRMLEEIDAALVGT
jgi:heterodisulfide reductase subunit A2